MNSPVQRALLVGAQVHKPPQAFRKVMSILKPRMAIAYHFINDFDTQPAIISGIREPYDGPLTLAADMMVRNVTEKGITARDIVYNENVWTAPIVERGEIDTSIRQSESQFLIDGKADMGDVIKKVYDSVNSRYGTDIQPEFGGDDGRGRYAIHP